MKIEFYRSGLNHLNVSYLPSILIIVKDDVTFEVLLFLVTYRGHGLYHLPCVSTNY